MNYLNCEIDRTKPIALWRKFKNTTIKKLKKKILFVFKGSLNNPTLRTIAEIHKSLSFWTIHFPCRFH